MSERGETQFRTDRPLASLRRGLTALPDAERRVAEAVLAEATLASRESVGELAARAGSSPATVVRLAHRLGLAGYSALRLALAEEVGWSQHFGHHAIGEPAGSSALRRALEDDSRSLREAAQAVDDATFDAAVDHVAAAAELLAVGVGASAALAELAAFRFTALGLPSSMVRDPLEQQLRAQVVRDGTVCLAISHTGASRATVEAARAASGAGAPVVAVTTFARSPLADLADVALVTGYARPGETELFANRVVHLSLIGALHEAVASRRPDLSSRSRRAAALVTRQQL
jgi:DNA-binding MurR/RpiR family transcriptional regulator